MKQPWGEWGEQRSRGEKLMTTVNGLLPPASCFLPP